MAESNRTGRLDRIEAALERLEAAHARDHEEFTRHHEELLRDHKRLMTWRVLMQDKTDREREDAARERRRLDQLWENTDKRIADLVTAIGQLIQTR